MKYETKTLEISKLKNNTGQIIGVPKNPRIIKDERFEKLKKSIQDDPEMLSLREVIAYDNNGELVVVAGNMRLKACKELGHKTVPTKVLEKDTTAEKLRAITIKDNIGFGEDDWELLNKEWDKVELEDWGIKILNTDFNDIDSFFEESKEEPKEKKITFVQIAVQRLSYENLSSRKWVSF